MSTSASFELPSFATSGPRERRRLRRFIDATTRDYVVEDGSLKQDEGFTSKVILALATRLGSAQAYPTFGSRLHEVKRADERGRRLAEKHAERALAHLAREVVGLKVEAKLRLDKPGAIEVIVSGAQGEETLNASYTAVVGA